MLARPGSGVLELEFFAVLETLNLQDRLAYISEEETQEENASFRLLRHIRPVRSAPEIQWHGRGEGAGVRHHCAARLTQLGKCVGKVL